MRSPVSLAPGESVTLRYAYGAAHAEQIAGARRRAGARPPSRSSAASSAWRDWLPRASFEGDRAWLQRELQWDAYMLRSGTTYEEACGHHIISQGGYYQYDIGFQGAFRDPLQHVLPLIYAEPWIAREVLALLGPGAAAVGGLIPYGMTEMCTRFDLGSSNDLDLWLLLTAAEYGLATRDLAFFDERVRWADGGDGDALGAPQARARATRSRQRGPHGGYIIGATGDWSDFSTQFDRDDRVDARDRAARLRLPAAGRAGRRARRHGVRRRAARRRRRAARRSLRRASGPAAAGTRAATAASNQIGSGAIYGEPQPWALLGRRAATASRRATLVGEHPPLPDRHRRAAARSRARRRSARRSRRRANDPDVTELDEVGRGVGVEQRRLRRRRLVRGQRLADVGARRARRRRARARASTRSTSSSATRSPRTRRAYPDHWNGVISVDDTCNAHYEADPSRCGIAIAERRLEHADHAPAGVEPVRHDQARRHRPDRATATGSTRTCR